MRTARKLLALLNPDDPTVRERFGIEAPAFVSPLIPRTFHCGLCGNTYGPLLYQVGRSTHTAHGRLAVSKQGDLPCPGIYVHAEIGTEIPLYRYPDSAAVFVATGDWTEDAFTPRTIALVANWCVVCTREDDGDVEGSLLPLLPGLSEADFRISDFLSSCLVPVHPADPIAPYGGARWYLSLRDGVPLFTQPTEVSHVS